MAMTIDQSVCSACGECEPLCPTGAILPNKGTFAIKASLCNECEDYDFPQCADVCEEEDCILPA